VRPSRLGEKTTRLGEHNRTPFTLTYQTSMESTPQYTNTNPVHFKTQSQAKIKQIILKVFEF